MKKIILNIVVMAFVLIVGVINVNAESFNLIKGESLITVTVDGVERHIYAKYEEGGTLDTRPLYCVSGINVRANEGTYSLITNSGLTERQLLDMGNIINSSTGTYVDKEFAIFTYLDTQGKRDNTHIAYKIVEDAKTATDFYINAPLDLSANKLIFTLEGEYYKSQLIYVSSNANIKDVTYSVTSSNSDIKPTIENNSNSFKVLVPKNEVVTLSELETIKVVVSANKVNPKAAVYYTADEYQDVTKVNEEVKKAVSKTIEGQVGITKLVINKLDENNQPLEGAKIKIECISQGCSFETKEIVTTQNAYILENIPYGEYKITEIEAPEGYSLLDQVFEVNFSSNDLVEEVTIQNQLTEVVVPDTLSSKSALLLTLAMINIALGIGLVTYIKTKKAENK